jgi:hypothetical protein
MPPGFSPRGVVTRCEMAETAAACGDSRPAPIDGFAHLQNWIEQQEIIDPSYGGKDVFMQLDDWLSFASAEEATQSLFAETEMQSQ